MKLIDQSQLATNPGYKLVMVDTVESRVGSYAEALKRRFPRQENQHKQPNSNTSEADTTKSRGLQLSSNRGKPPNFPVTERSTRPGQSPNVQLTEEKVKRGTLQGGDPADFQRDKHHTRPVIQSNEGVQNSNLNEKYKMLGSTLRKQMEEDKNSFTHIVQKVEETFKQKLTEIENANTTWMKELEDRVESKVEKIVEAKLLQASLIVANAVTKKVTNAMARMLNKHGISTDIRDDDTSLISQASAQTMTGIDSNTNGAKTSAEIGNKYKYTDNTKQMITALDEIGQTQTPPTDSPHDTLIESYTKQL